ncbi:hypothetical protein [Lishizhenia sp.]|uniref:hypothetical protein n=1 Tax=Lishizhenia sp. TaxID=2497594 RepID=UPI00299EB3BD|nr:hypothetical protein [Lishizhenia sp.]MDX1445103.1 hypothetical protein [Lishizhenia sp.]
MGLFNKKRKEKRQVSIQKVTKLESKELTYHPKIIIAWAKAIEGNTDLLNYLNENGFEELFMATYALKLKDEARDWLMKNGYPHLMAFINAAEGNQQALQWLKMNNFTALYYMAEAIDGEQNGYKGFAWLKNNATPDIFELTRIIKKLKDGIEENHNDVHSFGVD